MKKLLKFTPILIFISCFTLPLLLKQENSATKIIDLSTAIETKDIEPVNGMNKQKPIIDSASLSMGPKKLEGISQAQLLEKEVTAVKLSVNELSKDIKILTEQQTTITLEGSDYEKDLKINYLNKLIKIRQQIDKQKLSETHPQIKNDGLKAVDSMIAMMNAYIKDPNHSNYKSLGEEASQYIKKAFADVDLNNTLDIVKYLSGAGADQVTIGLKLRDAQTIATKFLTNYGYDDTPKGESYKKNKLQQVATQNGLDLKTTEFKELNLELEGLYQQLEEVTQ